MDTPLDVAADIGQVVLEASAGQAIDVRQCADAILSRHPGAGVRRPDIIAALAEEAGAAGVPTG